MRNMPRGGSMIVNREKAKLLLVDDHKIVRYGLAELFSTVDGWTVVGEAGTVAEAVIKARLHKPNVVLMDVRLPDGSGIDACRTIRSEHPDTRVIMLTAFADEDAVVEAIMAGAAGYLLKQIDIDHLVQAVENVRQGVSLLDPAITEMVLNRMRRLSAPAPEAPEDPLESLSEQERKILPLIADGKTNREIAAALYLSEHTVKTYVSSLLQKLNLSRRSQAAALASRCAQQFESTAAPEDDEEFASAA